METQRLLFRSPEGKDWELVREMIVEKQSEPLWYTDSQWPTEETSLRGVLSFLGTQKDWHLLFRKEDGALAGYVCLNPDAVPNIGFAIRKKYRSLGYATEAATAVMDKTFYAGAGLVESGTAMQNLPARRVLEKLGMRLVRVQSVSFTEDEDGAPIRFQGCLYQITKEKWDLMKKERVVWL